MRQLPGNPRALSLFLRRTKHGLLALTVAWGCLAACAFAGEARGTLTFEPIPTARFAFAGPVGERIRANTAHWLLQAPQANPGMLEMFRLRDRQPAPQLVPWAGEFAGKYLISAVQALRLDDDPRLRRQVAAVVADWIATQADDGYLGPFPRRERLLKHWDLWGHYHAILALVLWHEYSRDAAALAAARQAGDLVCATYLDTGRRVVDAGDPEMNMAILTGLALLHRLTGEPRYLRMAREVEKDWEKAGDYLRAGLDGREFFRSPRPRWESLHDLQGLVELWRITGEGKYREAFEHHWRSLRRWDRRNTGGFSSGEQATGNPYAPTAIETCCTVAWMALTADYLRLTGDPAAADDLELATLNGGLGAQHPSGRWWTYNTPMDGVREASAHTIVFQARAGTPELNCCSVNAPRVLGLLGDWAVMAAPDGLVVNWLGAGQCTGRLADGTPVTLTSSGEAWRDGHTTLSVATAATQAFVLRIRIPPWAERPVVTVNDVVQADALPGRYWTRRQSWAGTNRIGLRFELPVRFVPGAHEAAGKVSLYRGPLLLAFDQAQNRYDDDAVPALDLARLRDARVAVPPASEPVLAPAFGPWLTVEVPTTDGRPLRLVDFASAGARGTRYRSWLPATRPPPPPALTQQPPDAARVPLGPVRFQWRGPRARDLAYRVEFASDPGFAGGPAWSTNVAGTRVVLDTKALFTSRTLSPHTSGPVGGRVSEGRERAIGALSPAGASEAAPGPPRMAGEPDARLYWRVVSRSPEGETVPDVPPAWFRLDSAAPPQALPPEPKPGPNGELLVHALRGEAPPEYGRLKSARFSARDADGTEVNGRDQMLVYAVSPWPEEAFTVSLRVLIRDFPSNRLGQVFSAWAGGMDDPLRLVVDGRKLAARIEAGGGFTTPGVALETNRWYAVGAVKRGGTLTLYLDGQAAGSCAVPEFSSTRAEDCALGGNPHFSGHEFLAARFADFRFYARALAPEEMQALAVRR